MNDLNIFKSLPINQNKFTVNDHSNLLAVAYFRVSTYKQALNNHSLETQERLCEEFCVRNNFQLVAKFGGTYESAKTDDRKELGRMLAFLKKRNHGDVKNRISSVIVNSIDRFSRAGLHSEALAELKKLRIKVISVNNPVDSDTSSGALAQNIGLVFSQYDNDLRKEKTIVGMRNSLKNGYWPTRAPLGYDKVERVGNKNKKCVINVKGQLIKQAFRFKLEGQTNTHISAWLKSKGLILYRQKLTAIFKNPFYCGIIRHGLLDYEPVRGRQEIMLTEEEFIIINNLSSVHLKTHKTDDESFPLKSSIICDKCGRPFTAYHLIKKKAKYYKCNTVGCGVNSNINIVHNLFKDELGKYRVPAIYHEPLRKQLEYTFEQQNVAHKKEAQQLSAQINNSKANLEKLERRFVLDEIPRDLYQKYSNELSFEIASFEREFNKVNHNLSNLSNFIETSIKLCSNLRLLWEKGTLSIKQRLQKLVYPNGIRFNKELLSYRTSEINVIFKLIASIPDMIEFGITGQTKLNSDLSRLVAPTGIEPISKV